MMEELRNSPRYIKTFAEYIKSGDDEEIRALLTENVSGTIPVPELVYDAVKTAWTRDGIMNLVRKSYLKGNLKVGFEISSDGAQIHSEGADRIDEEQLVLGVVNLIPSNIKKYIAISDEIYNLAPEEFLTYVYSELTYQIAKKCGEELVNRIVSLSTQSNVPVVDYIDSPVTVSTVAMALSKLCSEAENPVIVMNKASWGQFKKAQYENKFRVDPFEGLPVVFNNALKPYNSATTGETYAIVGDFGNGALANYPNGEDILVKTDDITLAQSDLIKIIGRQYVAVDVVAPNHFTVINKGDEVTPIVPTGNIEITENGENINVAPYATATVNVSGGGGGRTVIVDSSYESELDGDYYYGSIENISPVTLDYLYITFDGVEYVADRNDDDTYGALWDEGLQGYDFSTYPFSIYFNSSPLGDSLEIYSETGGVHTIKIESEGGASVTIEELNVNRNDTYTAQEGIAYNPVVVNVPSNPSLAFTGTLQVFVDVSSDQIVVHYAKPVVLGDITSIAITNESVSSGQNKTFNKINDLYIQISPPQSNYKITVISQSERVNYDVVELTNPTRQGIIVRAGGNADTITVKAEPL